MQCAEDTEWWSPSVRVAFEAILPKVSDIQAKSIGLSDNLGSSMPDQPMPTDVH